LGNFINRVLVLTQKYYNGVVPQPQALLPQDEEVFAALKAYPTVIADSIERYRFREAMGEVMNVARLGNKYLADGEPWKTIKADPDRVQTQLFVALQVAAVLRTLTEPFLPFTATKLAEMLQLPVADWNTLPEANEWISAGHVLGASELLFPQIEDAAIEAQRTKLEATKTYNNQSTTHMMTPLKDTCTFEDFAKLDIRIGTILEAEKMPKANKLLVLKVAVGTDVRTIVSGIAEHFSPEEVIGKRVSVLVNLAPRALRGVESQGMILMAEDAQGKLHFVNPEGEGVPDGAVVS